MQSRSSQRASKRASVRACPLSLSLLYLCEQRPRKMYGFALEVVSKRPVSQHFEKSVVISVFANVVQVIVLAT